MAAETTIRDLFRSLEQTLHERLRVIEDVLRYAKGEEKVGEKRDDTNVRLLKMIEEQGERIKAYEAKIDCLQKQIEDIKLSNKSEKEATATGASLILRSPLSGIEIIPKKEVAIPIVNTPEPISYPDRLLLNKEARKALEKEEMGETPMQDHPNIEAEEEVEEEAEEEVEEEAEDNQKEVQMVVAEEEEAQEEEAEAEEVSLEEFEYKGSTYYRDPENNVYMLDEDGELTDPIGVWSEVKKRIIVKKPTVE